LKASPDDYDLVEEADEFLMPVTGHALADDPALQHVERGEQRRGAVALVSASRLESFVSADPLA
jgi:hypothetical protein